MSPTPPSVSTSSRNDPWSWRRFSRSHLRTVAGALLGIAGAAAYAHFVGCHTGTCPLTSNAWTASVYGGLVGAVAAWPARASS